MFVYNQIASEIYDMIKFYWYGILACGQVIDMVQYININ